MPRIRTKSRFNIYFVFFLPRRKRKIKYPGRYFFFFFDQDQKTRTKKTIKYKKNRLLDKNSIALKAMLRSRLNNKYCFFFTDQIAFGRDLIIARGFPFFNCKIFDFSPQMFTNPQRRKKRDCFMFTENLICAMLLDFSRKKTSNVFIYLENRARAMRNVTFSRKQ